MKKIIFLLQQFYTTIFSQEVADENEYSNSNNNTYIIKTQNKVDNKIAEFFVFDIMAPKLLCNIKF